MIGLPIRKSKVLIFEFYIKVFFSDFREVERMESR